MNQTLELDFFIDLVDDLPGGIGVFQVHDFEDLKVYNMSL